MFINSLKSSNQPPDNCANNQSKNQKNKQNKHNGLYLHSPNPTSQPDYPTFGGVVQPDYNSQVDRVFCSIYREFSSHEFGSHKTSVLLVARYPLVHKGCGKYRVGLRIVWTITVDRVLRCLHMRCGSSNISPQRIRSFTVRFNNCMRVKVSNSLSVTSSGSLAYL